MDEVSSHVCLVLPFDWRQGRPKDCSASSSNPMMEEPWCRFRREARDIDIAVVDSLKVLDPKRPIREGGRWSRWHSMKWLNEVAAMCAAHFLHLVLFGVSKISESLRNVGDCTLS
jgi:hypothetical protein